MVTEETDFLRWLAEARVLEETLTAEQLVLLQAGSRFLETCGRDYYSMRLLGHVLLHCQSGLSVAGIARLLGISRAAASGQQKLSSKEVVQAAHQRLRGRAHGKLLPRFAGPIAQFLLQHPQATRWDLLDFIEATWGVRVSRMALHKFLKKYGLDQVHEVVPLPATQAAEPTNVTTPARPGGEAVAPPPVASVPAVVEAAPAPGQPVPLPPRNFFLPPPTTQGLSCCCPTPSTGSPRRSTASRTTTARCGRDC